MAKGDWWFKFDIKAWRNSPELRSCSLATRGFWTDCIAIMRHSGQATLTDTVENLARSIGCFPSEAEACIEELKQTKTADVTLRNGRVTLKSRKYAKEIRAKELSNLRVKRHREKQDVTPEKRLLVISNKKEVREEEEIHTHTASDEWTFPMKELVEAFPDYLPDRITPAMIGFIEADVGPGDEDAWKQTIELYQKNFNPMTKSYLPDKVGNVLDVFRKKKAELERANNAANQRNSTTAGGRYPAKRTDQDVIAESADFYANYPDPN